MHKIYLSLLMPVLSLQGWSQITYCSSGASTVQNAEIVNVVIGMWNNYSGPPTGVTSSDFTNLQGPILKIGESYNISLTSEFAPGYLNQEPCCVEVYIDFNHDGYYSEFNEIVFGTSTSIASTDSGSIIVPNTILPAITGMRVVLEGTNSVSYVHPCGTYFWGETEDYLVTLVPSFKLMPGLLTL